LGKTDAMLIAQRFVRERSAHRTHALQNGADAMDAVQPVTWRYGLQALN